MKRVFIALKTNPEIEERVKSWKEDKLAWPVRFIEPRNLHLTLVPPFNCENISALIDTLSSIKTDQKKISIAYKLIDFGPRPENPRLIWALGDYNLELDNLKNKIENSLNQKRISRNFHPHLTLARFKNLPFFAVKEKINWQEIHNSFVLFESILKPKGAEYNIIKKFKF